VLSVLAQDKEQSFDILHMEKKHLTRTVLESDGARQTKYRIAYDVAYEKDMQPMRRPKESAPPVTDSPYTFEQFDENAPADSAVLKSRRAIIVKDYLVTRDDGNPISEEEEAFLGSEHRAKLESSLRNALNGRTMEVGEELLFDEESLAMMETGMIEGDMNARDARMRLKALESVDGSQTAVLDFDAMITGGENVMEMEVRMQGVLHIGVDNLWPVSLEMTGTVTGAGMHQGATMGIDAEIHGMKKLVYRMN